MSLNHSCFDEPNHEYMHDSDLELGGKITLLAGQINAATYLFLKMLAEFDRRKGWCKNGIRSCSHWLTLNCSLAVATAHEHLRVAHCLEKLPKTNEGFESGVLSYSKVRAMTRVATDDNEAILISAAANSSASHVENLVRKYRQVDADQNPIEPKDEYQQRKLTAYQNKDGMWIINAKLPQLEGGLVVKALEEIMRQQDRNSSAEESKEAQENSSAEESEEVRASFSQKRADALSSMSEHFIATATVDDENGGIQALAGHERCQVVLHLNLDNADTPPNMDYHCISVANAKRFSSDASLYTVLEDRYGDVLNIGRKARTISPPLARALNVRDETCCFPGCCANKYVDFHHVTHWIDGGETNPDNLIKLCRFHHRQLHQGHYSIALQPDDSDKQKWIFKTAAGEVIEPNPRLLQGRNKEFLETQWPDIDSHTAVSRWRGGTFDYPTILEDLVLV
jgi:hypothetical protein